MWRRKELRKKGRHAFRGNYWQGVLACVVVLVLCTGFSFVPVGGAAVPLVVDDLASSSPTQVVDTISRAIFGQSLPLWEEFSKVDQSTNGLLAALFRSASAAGSLAFGALNVINQFVFGNSVSAVVILAVGAALLFAYWLFVNSVLRVGEARFFLESRCYPGSGLGRLFMVYRVRATRSVAFTMFMRELFCGLWSLTIVGGFIKEYSYRMVPYILAENPKVGWRTAITTSRRMMAGQKWRAFLLDLSFFGWDVLDLFTFGLLGIFYVNPYKAATNAELYMTMREAMLAADPEMAGVFRDAQLAPQEEAPGVCYPEHAYHIPEHKGRQWLAADYHRKYGLIDLVLLFFTFCFIGYVYEVLYYLIGSGILVNRGTLYGPWLPIYGTGGIAILLLLKPLVNKPVVLFFSIMGVCGVIEYTTAWFLETYLHTKWWDYTGFFMNIQGRVCLEGLLAFACLGMLGIYVIAPSLAKLYDRMPQKLRIGLCVGLTAAFLGDLAYSHFVSPNMSAAEPMIG